MKENVKDLFRITEEFAGIIINLGKIKETSFTFNLCIHVEMKENLIGRCGNRNKATYG